LRKLKRDEERVLAELLNSPDPWRLAGHVKTDFPHFIKTLETLERRQLISIEEAEILLTAQGRKLAARERLLPASEIPGRIQAARKEMASLCRGRPRTTTHFDQGYMTVDSLFRRVSLMARMGDANGKRIAVLGDDDLISIALCLATEPEHISVLEIDGRLVDFINDIAGARGFPIKALGWDFRNPLPAEFRGRFDSFVTDPSETLPGLKMFLSRGIYTLKPGEGGAGYFGLTSIEASYRKWRTLQTWMLRSHKLAITHILPGYAYYHNWRGLARQTEGYGLAPFGTMPEKTWFNSALIRVETIEGFTPRQTGRTRGSLFEDDESCGTTKEI
jgi:predicted methyltransferase